MQSTANVMTPAVLLSDADMARLVADIEDTTEKMARYILHTADYARTDRLWPADFLVFITNPLNVAYGACGTSLFLQDVLGGLPREITDWMLQRPLSVETYPPGLYVGLAGIAYTFMELGLVEKAEAVLEMLYRSPLLYDEPGVFMGAADCGRRSTRARRAAGVPSTTG